MADYSGVLHAQSPQPNNKTVGPLNSFDETIDHDKSALSITDTLQAKQEEIDYLKSDNKTTLENFCNLLRSVQNDKKILREKIKNLEEKQNKYELTLRDLNFENNKLRDELDRRYRNNTSHNVANNQTNTHPNSSSINNLDKILELLTSNLQKNYNNSKNKNQVIDTSSTENDTNNENNISFEKLIKKFKRFETINNPRTSIHYFKEEFHRLNIHNNKTKYDILIERWPTSDISNYYRIFSREKRNFTTFCEYCENRDNHLTEVLGKIPQYDNTTPFSVYLADATKWAESDKNDLIKFFAFYLAPKAIKPKIKENFDESFEIFVKQIRRTWNNRQDESLNPIPINFDKTQKNYYKQPKPSFKPRDEYTQRLDINNNNNFRYFSQEQSHNFNTNNNNRKKFSSEKSKFPFK